MWSTLYNDCNFTTTYNKPLVLQNNIFAIMHYKLWKFKNKLQVLEMLKHIPSAGNLTT
jgi:hypothetical protein